MGQTRILRRAGKRRELSPDLGGTLLGKSDQQDIAHTMCGEDTVTALPHHQGQIAGALIMSERPNAHRAGMVKGSVAASAEIDGDNCRPMRRT